MSDLWTAAMQRQKLFELALGTRPLRDRKKASSRRKPCSIFLAVGCLAAINHNGDPISKALGECPEDAV